MKILGTTVVVVGGASGLGEGVVRSLMQKGSQVAILDLDETRGEIVANETGASFFATDIVSADSVSNAMDKTFAKFGTARVLVNCAGIGPAEKAVGDKLEPHRLESFRRTIDLNVVGTFNTCCQFASRLAACDLDGEERGVVINTASVAAYDGQIGHCGYASSKAAVIGLTLPLAREFAAHAIRVATIAPGNFLTPMFEHNLSPEQIAAIGAMTPFPKRLGRPEEFALMVEAIIINPMINGETIRVDGCLSLAGMQLGDALVRQN